jgi:hypothetical protein
VTLSYGTIAVVTGSSAVAVTTMSVPPEFMTNVVVSPDAFVTLALD